MNSNRPPLKRIEEVLPGFNSYARLNNLSMQENMILSALFRVYSPEELCLLFGIEWPLK